MYGSEKALDGSDRTAFRKAEKKYKLYYDDSSKSSKKKKRPKEVDLSEVLDFKSVLESYSQNGDLSPGIIALQCDFDRPVFCLERRPGFYFIPGALEIEEQCQWIRESLTTFPQPPNRTNHNAFYGPINQIFIAAKEKKVLVEEVSVPPHLESECQPSISDRYLNRWEFYEEHTVSLKGNACKSISASVLLRKLRWSTLGLQFDWSKRNYDESLPHNKIPDSLCQLAKRMAAPAMPKGEQFQPEAAIVNYFGIGDALGGHLDDMEADWRKPIVSISLGCKAVFLLGGKSRDDPPLAMFLRSGDIVLMAGEARECFHGFYFIPGALEIEEQCQWIRESLTTFPQPPNRTNHNAFYGPINQIFIAAKEKKVLVEEVSVPPHLESECHPSISDRYLNRWEFYEEHTVSLKGNACKSISASVLLRKLRWSTLGLQFDWSKRNYDESLPHNKIPDSLCQLAKRMAAPAMPKGEQFQPEAAIVNYFGIGDALGGHLDDMEADWSKPIVSISLGCKAVFLLGGKSRDDPPLAMFLRSGDIVLMAGEARECFHELYFLGDGKPVQECT
ncbi:Alpha-ketoglutarate-dependent dioxygenase alkB [Morella rubra]|uniref:Alpha-ketoglutarate-dependent dioxygenase alkB n=1 Tax=Morella rubra TaxID=262757 RepID=A0A6A1WKL3_9ROSI|nr:Alpha-ketoglutarate-dependent dioxygenase alkB [Morella rubra]